MKKLPVILTALSLLFCVLSAGGSSVFAEAPAGENGPAEDAARQILPWPETGLLYENPAVKGGGTELIMQLKADPGFALMVKVTTPDGVPARTLFVGGDGETASAFLPAGVYSIMCGVGTDWYGEAEAFGPEGDYETVSFGDRGQELEMKENYRYTFTLDARKNQPDTDEKRPGRMDWNEFINP